jgi:hypothetical protein
MGYAGEDTLARRLKRADLDRDSALRFFVQIARGVLALHDRRLAHFDLKPSNVFLNGDVARVGDYGLAKLLIEGRATLSFGRGTPHYMAPRDAAQPRRPPRRPLLAGRHPVREPELPPARSPPTRRRVRAARRRRPPEFPYGFPARAAAGGRALPAPRAGAALRLGARAPVELGTDRAPGRLGAPAVERARSDRPAGAGPPHGEPRRAARWRNARAREELRSAAAELARGAVGVRRGVWDGVRGGVVEHVASARGDGAGSATRIPALGDDGSEVLEIQSLEEPDEQALVPRPSLSAPDAPWRLELRRARESSGAPLAAAPAGAPALATVPVPPRAEGGFLGSVVQVAGGRGRDHGRAGDRTGDGARAPQRARLRPHRARPAGRARQPGAPVPLPRADGPDRRRVRLRPARRPWR